MDQIESLLQRPKLYNNIDGVGELSIGFMLLGFALLTWLQARSPAGAIWHRMDVFVAWVGLMLLGIHFGSKAVKEHVTYRRTGFVEYQKRDSIWRPMILAFFVSLLIIGGLVLAAHSRRGMGRSHWGMTTPVALAGLAIANSYAYGIARSVRWKWAVVGAIAICSVTIAMLPADVVGAIVGSSSGIGAFSAGSAGAWLLLILTYGAIMLISGGISFWLYLRHTQPPAQAAA